MDASSGDCARVLHLIIQAQVVEKLLGRASAINAKPTERVLRYVDRELRRLAGRQTPIKLWESLLCDTVIEAGRREHPAAAIPGLYSVPKTEEPQLATVLEQLIFGPMESDASFARIMCSQTYEKAGLVLRACILALEDALAPTSAFQILVLASEVRSQRLLARAAAYALLHFADAVRHDVPGFRALPKDLLGRLLSHDCLQVDSEVNVFFPLAQWVMADEDARLQHLYPLTVDCVRVNLMKVQELYALDAHPLMARCPDTMKHVAYGYLAICYGCSVPEEHSYMSGKSHKPRIAVDEAALSFLQQHGVDITATSQPLQQHRDLFRLYPASLGAPDQAASSPSAAAPGAALGAPRHPHAMKTDRRWGSTAPQQLSATERDAEHQEPYEGPAAAHVAHQQMPESSAGQGSGADAAAEQAQLQDSSAASAMGVDWEPCVFSASPRRRQYRHVTFEERHAGSLEGNTKCSPSRPGKERALSRCGHQRRLF